MSGARVHLTAADPLVADHRIGGTPVVAAAAQIDLLLRACDAARPDRVRTLEHVAFRAPLRVTGPGTVLDVTTDDGRCALRCDGTEYATARHRDAPLPPPRYLDVAGLGAGCAEPVPLAGLDAWRRASGITYGPAYRAIRSARRGPGRILAVVRAGDDTTCAPAFVPPPLLDSVFQALGLLDAGAAGACLPWYVGRITARRRITGTVLALVEREAGEEAANGAVRGRATVCNQQGEVLLELD
ncbi:polyketide synthase dehydratase domain-containing protein, partial [Streptomyces sp. McG6]